MPQTLQYSTYASGMNAAALPFANMRNDELSLIVNGTVRRGFVQSRPGWEWLPISFIDSASQYAFEQGKFQGSESFLSDKGNVAAFAVEGRVFAYDPTTGYVVEQALSSRKAPFSKFSEHIWLRQRSKWLIAQDGISPPLRTDGSDIEQSLVYEGEPSIPTGTIMVEGWGRLFVVDPSRRRIYASDHEMDPNSTPISFTEGTDYYLNARYFEGPPALGRIMGAAFTPYQDSSTGIGPLVVFFEKGTRAYNVGVPRPSWITADISQTILPRVGSSTFFAYADRGSEIVFRDQDGRIRTIKNAQQFEALNGGQPNDFAIWDIIKGEDSSLRRYCGAETFDRRTFILTHPERSYLPDGRFNVFHRGMAVMENENLSDKRDVWTFWTGLNICGMTVVPINGEEVLIAFCRDPDGVNRLYKLTKAGMYDKTPTPAGVREKRIRMTVATPTFDFNSPIVAKTFSSSGARLSGLRGEVEISGRWQIDQFQPSNWFTDIKNFANCVQFSKNAQGECLITTTADGVLPREIFPSVPEDRRRFYSGSAILDIYGPATLEELAIVAEVAPASSSTTATCKPTTPGPAQASCPVNPLCYNAFNAPVANQPDVKVCPLP